MANSRIRVVRSISGRYVQLKIPNGIYLSLPISVRKILAVETCRCVYVEIGRGGQEVLRFEFHATGKLRELTDPDQALALLRLLAGDIEAPWAAAFSDLDEWLSKGGKLPADWAYVRVGPFMIDRKDEGGLEG